MPDAVFVWTVRDVVGVVVCVVLVAVYVVLPIRRKR